MVFQSSLCFGRARRLSLGFLDMIVSLKATRVIAGPRLLWGFG